MRKSLVQPLTTLSMTSWRQVHTSLSSNQRHVDAVKKLADEKRGVFRVLNIGKPKPMGKKKAFEERRNEVKALPR